ncbi:hypothetical protein [Thermogemmatispora carboxidivorans]|uniref:hypothetical protein n=1 Tax=Thermogemmatispora carboxidivorans TaxID=1382306 RepID=UPI00069A5E4B|nr:hypothetical protein [Thermogemmatispora carboxidivorans]
MSSALTGKQIRYSVDGTRKPYWAGVVELANDRYRYARVTITTKGYEGQVEWVAYDHIIAVRSERGRWVRFAISPPSPRAPLDSLDPA